jgi:hypothetical protein
MHHSGRGVFFCTRSRVEGDKRAVPETHGEWQEGQHFGRDDTNAIYYSIHGLGILRFRTHHEQVKGRARLPDMLRPIARFAKTNGRRQISLFS